MKITAGPVHEAIANLSPVEKRAYVLNAFASLAVPEAYEHQGARIAIASISARKDRLVVFPTATRNGKAVDFPKDALPLEFVNPPFLAPDGTYSEETVAGHGGKSQTVQRPNLKEDLAAALQIIVGDAIQCIVNRGVS